MAPDSKSKFNKKRQILPKKKYENKKGKLYHKDTGNRKIVFLFCLSLFTLSFELIFYVLRDNLMVDLTKFVELIIHHIASNRSLYI